jgi:coenzyme F420 hydrogenase subunit beta
MAKNSPSRLTQHTAWQRLEKEVIDQGLCTRCGSCAGLCQTGSIRFRDPFGECLPEKVKPCNCEACQTASWQACPGKTVPFPSLEKRLFGHVTRNRFLGEVYEALVGYSNNPEIRSQSASGGLITATLLHLLKTKKISAAAVVGYNHRHPWQPEVQLAKTPQTIMAAAQSKYALVPVNSILKQLTSFPGKVAVVGLPDQIQSLRKLELYGHPAVKNIAYLLGSYSGINLHFTAVKSFLKNHGLTDLSQVTSLKFRAGAWPGNMRVETKDGQVFELPKFYANYLIPFYAVQRDLLSVDLSNELADISYGDAWAPKYEERHQGWSLVLTRTAKGIRLIEEMRQKGVVKLDPIPLSQAINMHSHMLDFKKRGAFIRISRKPSVQQPNYGYYPTNIPFKRQLFESIISTLFWFGQTRLARFLIEHIPLTFSGTLFMQARLFWKKLTYTTKRKGLSELRFKIT